MQIPTPYEGIGLPLIMDGRLIRENMNFAMLDENWLKIQLDNNGVKDIGKVLIAQLENSGTLHISTKYEDQNVPDEF